MKKDDLEFGSATEFTPLPDEFGENTRAPDTPSPKKRGWRKKAFLISAAMIFAGMLILPSERKTQTAPDNSQPPQPTVTDGVILPTANGTVYYTVNNCSFDENYMPLVLAEDSISVADLAAGASITLPQPVQVDGYEFVCWVMSGRGDPMPVTNGSIGIDDVRSRMPDENGDIRITVNAVWRPVTDNGMRFTLTMDANGGAIDDDQSKTVNACGPLMSGTNTYPAAYGTPQRDGYIFTGWFADAECSGDSVKIIPATSFFAVNANGETDWSAPITVTLYAGWAKQ